MFDNCEWINFASVIDVSENIISLWLGSFLFIRGFCFALRLHKVMVFIRISRIFMCGILEGYNNPLLLELDYWINHLDWL